MVVGGKGKIKNTRDQDKRGKEKKKDKKVHDTQRPDVKQDTL